MTDATKPELPLHHIAAKVPAVPGWRVLAFAHDAEGKRIEVRPDAYAITEHPIVAWGILVSISQYAGFGAFLGFGGGEPQPCPLDENGNRMNTMVDFICLSPPGETAQEAVDRIEAPTRKVAEKTAKGAQPK